MYKEKVQPKLSFLNKFYTGKEWALGYLTTADFYVYSLVSGVRSQFKDQFDGEFGGTFLPFLKRFESIPSISAY